MCAFGALIKEPLLSRCRCSTSTRRCCRAGAAPPRSSGRSWPATSAPGSRSCGSPRGSTAGRCAPRSPSRSRPEDTYGTLAARLAAARRRAARRARSTSSRRAPSRTRRWPPTRRRSAAEDRVLDPARPAVELERVGPRAHAAHRRVRRARRRQAARRVGRARGRRRTGPPQGAVASTGRSRARLRRRRARAARGPAPRAGGR